MSVKEFKQALEEDLQITAEDSEVSDFLEAMTMLYNANKAKSSSSVLSGLDKFDSPIKEKLK